MVITTIIVYQSGVGTVTAAELWALPLTPELAARWHHQGLQVWEYGISHHSRGLSPLLFSPEDITKCITLNCSLCFSKKLLIVLHSMFILVALAPLSQDFYQPHFILHVHILLNFYLLNKDFWVFSLIFFCCQDISSLFIFLCFKAAMNTTRTSSYFTHFFLWKS